MTEPSPTAPSPEAGFLAANLADLVTRAARREPTHPALVDVDGDRRLTWEQFDRAVDGQAALLVGAGLRPGHRVVLRLPTSIAFCVAFFGVLRAGGVAVPVGSGGAYRELERVLTSSDAALLFAAADDAVAQEAAGACGATRLAPPDPAADPAPGAAADGAAAEPASGGEDLAVLAFTSGTSGRPRGVMLSHRALLANLAQCAALRPAPMTAADRVLLAVPLFHAYGLGPGLLQVANSAATAVLLGRFDAVPAARAVHRHRVTVVVGVPPMYRMWLDELSPAEFADTMRTVRLYTCGAAPLPADVLAGVRAATGRDVYEGYGLTETGPAVTSTLVDGVAKPGSVGKPLPGVPELGVGPVELRLVDAHGNPLPGGAYDADAEDDEDEDAGGTGLVAVRGPNLFSGYWPDGASAPGEIPGLGPGWVRTGDVGYLDADGDLHLVDRADDLIIVSGFNVYPREVEDVLLEHPGVREAAAIGVPHPRTGEAVRAVLVAAEGGAPSAEEIVAHCARRLARFKVPVEVAVVDALPHLPTGKLARRRLREGIDPDVIGPASPTSTTPSPPPVPGR